MLFGLVCAPLLGVALLPLSVSLGGSKGVYLCALSCSLVTVLGLGVCLVVLQIEPSIYLDGGPWFNTQSQGAI